MTWEQLLGKIREGLRESGALLRQATEMVAGAGENNRSLDDVEVAALRAMLVLAMSNIISSVEHLEIGLDAVIETLREASQSQEVNGE